MRNRYKYNPFVDDVIMSAKKGIDFLRQHFAAMAKTASFHRLGAKVGR